MRAIGRYDRLKELFKESSKRSIQGSAQAQIAGAREGLWMMTNHPEDSFKCGPMALDRIRASLNPADAFNPKLVNSRSSSNGFSLTQVKDLAQEIGTDFVMAKRDPGADVIVPAVVHWKLGHFAPIIKELNGRYLIQDPTFRSNMWVTKKALDSERADIV